MKLSGLTEGAMGENQKNHSTCQNQDGGKHSSTSQKNINSHRKHKHSQHHHSSTSHKITGSFSEKEHHHHSHHHSHRKHGSHKDRDSRNLSHSVDKSDSIVRSDRKDKNTHRKRHHIDKDTDRQILKQSSSDNKSWSVNNNEVEVIDNNNKPGKMAGQGLKRPAGLSPRIVHVKRRRSEVDKLKDTVYNDSDESSDEGDMESKLNFLGNTPFTRKQKDKIYKIFGRTKPAKPKKLNYYFDPSIFDNEKSSDSDDDIRKIELKSKSDMIVSEYLIPIKKCVETLDKIVEDNHDTDTDEELPDLEIIDITESTTEFKPVKKNPLLSQEPNLKGMEYLYPGLKLCPVTTSLVKEQQLSLLQPVVRINKINWCSESVKRSSRKMPRLVLKKETELSDTSQERNIFDDLQKSMGMEGTNVENNPVTEAALVECIDSSDSSSDDDISPRERGGFKKFEAGSIPSVTTSVLLDEYSQKYRYRTPKPFCHQWIPSQPIAESLLPEYTLSPRATKVIPFFSNMVHMIDSCHDEGKDFYLKVLQLVTNFSTTSMEAPMSILRKVLFDILLTCEDVYKVQMSYNLLVDLLDKHPPRDEVPFEWKDLELVVQELHLPCGWSAVESRVSLLQRALALKYMTCAIEKELLHRTVTQQRQVCKSLAYQWLSCEVAFPHVRSIIRWLVQSMSFGEYDDLQINFLGLCISEPQPSSSDKGKDFQETWYFPKVFPLLEKLLDLSLAVSRQPLVCAARIANDLALEYNHLANLVHKKFLLENLSHPLLRLKVVSRILSNCDTEDEMMIRTDVRGMQDIVNGHFLAKPPLSAFTPPTTPENEGDDCNSKDVCRNQYPVEAVEELIMLIYFSVHSYLEVDKGNYTESLSRRVLDEKTDVNRSADAEVLKNMKHHVKKLERRLIEYCGPDTSKNIKLYLTCLYCVGPTSQNACIAVS